MLKQHSDGASITPRAQRFAPGAVLLLALIAGGCYRYVPVEPAAIRPNEEVRVRVSETAATRLANDFGAYVSTLNGQVTTQSSDSLGVSVQISRLAGEVALSATRQILVFARPEVLEVSRRQLSRGRTAIAATGVVAAFVLLINSVVQIGDENPGGEDPPPPPPAGYQRIFRIPIH